MKRNKFAALIAFVLLGSILSLDALADRGGHHGHHGGHFGIYIDPWPSYSYYPYYRPYAYYPRYYDYPAVIAAPASPPVYIERNDTLAQSDRDDTGYWYYCSKPKGYYPYVRECRSGWQKVPAEPDDK